MKYVWAVCLFMLVVPARAEPGPVITSLMDEPASAFSLGMYRADLEAERVADVLKNTFIEKVTGTANYDWDKNRIAIYFYVGKDALVKLASASDSQKDKCRTAFNIIREQLWIDAKDGKPYFQFSRIATLFKTIGYKKKNLPEENWAILDEAVEIRLRYQGLTCAGPLRSNVLTFDK